jgi:hypothetical protein
MKKAKTKTGDPAHWREIETLFFDYNAQFFY